jgi:CheY-like chemotaxis protein
VRYVRGRRRRVLVVDDNPVIRDLITLNLELEGFEVVTAVDGQDCLEQVVLLQPDLVTLDVVMPRLNGFDTARRLKTDPETAHLPVMFVTASAQASDLAMGAEVGADAYLTKPFEPEVLVAAVRRLAG